MRLQRLVIVFTVAFAVTLALVIGQRLSSDMIAVIVGVVAGVVASIPTSLIILWAARSTLASRGRSLPANEYKSESQDRDTKIIVVPAPPANHAASNAYLPFGAAFPPYAPSSPPRQFTIIGGEATPEERPWP